MKSGKILGVFVFGRTVKVAVVTDDEALPFIAVNALIIVTPSVTTKVPCELKYALFSMVGMLPSVVKYIRPPNVCVRNVSSTDPAKVPLLGVIVGFEHLSRIKYFLITVGLSHKPSLNADAINVVIPSVSTTIASPEEQDKECTVSRLPSIEYLIRAPSVAEYKRTVTLKTCLKKLLLKLNKERKSAYSVSLGVKLGLSQQLIVELPDFSPKLDLQKKSNKERRMFAEIIYARLSINLTSKSSVSA